MEREREPEEKSIERMLTKPTHPVTTPQWPVFGTTHTVTHTLTGSIHSSWNSHGTVRSKEGTCVGAG